MHIEVNWFSEFFDYFNKYVYKDWTYAIYLLIPILLDTIIESYNAKCNHVFKFSNFWEILKKIFIYIGILIIIHALSSFAVKPIEFQIFNIIRICAVCLIILKECISIFKGVKRFRGYLISQRVLKRKLNKIK